MMVVIIVNIVTIKLTMVIVTSVNVIAVFFHFYDGNQPELLFLLLLLPRLVSLLLLRLLLSLLLLAQTKCRC